MCTLRKFWTELRKAFRSYLVSTLSPIIIIIIIIVIIIIVINILSLSVGFIFN